MKLKSVAFSAAEEVHPYSDIESLHFDANGLVVVVARELMPNGQVRGLQVKFELATALRYLDEVDIATYWMSNGFVRGHHVLEILEGGWADEESSRKGYTLYKQREWLVVTGNGCISVFSSVGPVVNPIVYVPA